MARGGCLSRPVGVEQLSTFVSLLKGMRLSHNIRIGGWVQIWRIWTCAPSLRAVEGFFQKAYRRRIPLICLPEKESEFKKALRVEEADYLTHGAVLGSKSFSFTDRRCIEWGKEESSSSWQSSSGRKAHGAGRLNPFALEWAFLHLNLTQRWNAYERLVFSKR